ncbi:hypothetical protein DV735_g5308, partial [Chaetothyriales sp. CBS 134920]
MGDASSHPQTNRQYAEQQDQLDPLATFRSEFIIPSLADIHRETIAKSEDESPSPPSTYLCGNSLGLQPRQTASIINTFLTQWATKAVKGHFFEHTNSPLPSFTGIDDEAANLAAPIVGALPSEVAVMSTLTANLHFLLASFYEPTPSRHKILLEAKAFPSDHFAIQSHIAARGYDPNESMILISPPDPSSGCIPTQHILDTITANADSLALILLPGVQFYTGQVLDIPTITAHAQSLSPPITIGWDLAHSAGNVPLSLHDWNVDFAAWCHYKYLNSGPGATAGLFVHERHGRVDMSQPEGKQYRHRLSGWWAEATSTRFNMTNKLVPRDGAKGWQVSNPSAIDCASVISSLRIVQQAGGISRLREKSVKLTNYLEFLLDDLAKRGGGGSDSTASPAFEILTPRNPAERGAQLSIKINDGGRLLDTVLDYLDANGVVIDERKPDVIRVAPAPLYNSYVDVWNFVKIFGEALAAAKQNADVL